mmetsp:Transcript_38221/g.90273  ORF Transcript_38221/g.90273 Transcript_38221/m.90273 type:complete len:286 (+) Transcript_38221:962-1819(+)
MRGLASVSDVDDALSLLGADAVPDGRQIRRRVQEPAVGLADQERRLVLVFVGWVLEEDDLGALALFEQLGLAQVLAHVREERVVERLPTLLQRHLERVVDGLELLAGCLAQQLPPGERDLVAGLQLHHLLARLVLELLALVEALLGLAVEVNQVPDCQVLQPLIRRKPLVLEVGDEHAELRAPVPDVVEAQHIVALELSEAGEAVADDGGAEVPDVHLLGDVRRREVDHDPLRLGGGRHSQTLLVLQHLLEARGDEVGLELEVDEPWACNLRRLEGAFDLRGKLS